MNIKTSFYWTAPSLFSASAMAEDTSVSNDISWALTLERQTEANANTGELMGTMEVLGLDVSAGGLWNIDKSGEDFIDLNKTMLNFSHSLSTATLYLKNDFDTDWERTESTVGLKITF